MVKEVRLPEISENVDSGTVIGVLVSKGDSVEKEDPLVELETEKAAFEVPAPFGGTVAEVAVHEGDEVKVGQVIVKLEVKEKKEQPGGKESTETEEEEGEKKESEEAEHRQGEEKAAPEYEKKNRAGEEEGRRVFAPAAPSVRRLARELGVDIDQVEGSGSGGRISSEDVKAYTKRTIESADGRKRNAVLPDFTAWGDVSRESMSGVRKATARSVTAAWEEVPHVTQYDKADITEMERFRKEYAKTAEKAGGKLTVTAILLKVTAAALGVFGQFNASLDMEKQEIIYKHYIHIGVAVDTGRGLLVPVIRDVNRKNIVQLTKELADAAEKARNRKIKPDEMKGGTFTLSNLGGIGGTGFAPVVFWPQAAILGVSRARTEAVYRDGRFEPRLILPLSLSYDHRLIDGADGTRFLHWITEALEKPLLIFLEGGQ